MVHREDQVDRFIYALVDPRPGIKKAYIGQSIDPVKRYKAHVLEVRRGKCENIRKIEWFDELERLGLFPQLVILQKIWANMFSAFGIEMEETIKYRDAGYDILSVRPEKIDQLVKKDVPPFDVEAHLEALMHGVYPVPAQESILEDIRRELYIAPPYVRKTDRHR